MIDEPTARELEQEAELARLREDYNESEAELELRTGALDTCAEEKALLREDRDRLREALSAEQDAAIAVIECWRKFYRYGTTKEPDVDGWVENLAGKWIQARDALKETT